MLSDIDLVVEGTCLLINVDQRVGRLIRQQKVVSIMINVLRLIFKVDGAPLRHPEVRNLRKGELVHPCRVRSIDLIGSNTRLDNVDAHCLSLLVYSEQIVPTHTMKKISLSDRSCYLELPKLIQ